MNEGGLHMKRLWTKIPTAVGMIISLHALNSLIKMFIYYLFPAILDDGTSIYDPEISAWLCSISVLLNSAFSMAFYIIDAILSIVKACMNIDKKFNIILATVVFLGAWIGIQVIATPIRTYKTVIWFSYYFLIVAVFEIISIIRYIKQRRKKQV
jgi:hypothetical protein